jgi:hypothetical protein
MSGSGLHRGRDDKEETAENGKNAETNLLSDVCEPPVVSGRGRIGIRGGMVYSEAPMAVTRSWKKANG